MKRIDALVKRLEEPRFRDPLAISVEVQREQWRRQENAYRQVKHLARPKTHRSYVHRWQDIQARKAFLVSGNPCQRCGSTIQLEVSHKVAVKDGGTWDTDNLQWLCHQCDVQYDSQARSIVRTGKHQPQGDPSKA